MQQKKVYKDGLEMAYNDAPGALDILKSFGWSEEKPKEKEKPKAKKAKE